MALRLKILLVFMLLFTVVFGTAFFAFYQITKELAMENLRESLKVSASTAANLVDADELLRVYEGVDDNEAEYDHVASQLQLVLDANPKAMNVYTLIPSGAEDELLFVVDLESDYDSVGVGYDISETPEILEAFDGPMAETEPVEDEYGVTLSGFAPIRDSSGKSVAIVGVEMPAQDVYDLQDMILFVSVIAFVVAYAGVFLAAVLISGTVTRRLRAITDAAKLLEADEPFEPQSLATVGRGKDELGKLARVFSEMATQVQQREQKLKQEVVQLRIEIDETKRNKQVSEIADTEYFRDLQKKARELRGQNKGSEEA